MEPTSGAKRTVGKGRSARGQVRQSQALAAPRQVDRVLAGDVSTAHRMETDLSLGAGSGLAVAAMNGAAHEVHVSAPSRGLCEAAGGA